VSEAGGHPLLVLVGTHIEMEASQGDFRSPCLSVESSWKCTLRWGVHWREGGGDNSCDKEGTGRSAWIGTLCSVDLTVVGRSVGPYAAKIPLQDTLVGWKWPRHKSPVMLTWLGLPGMADSLADLGPLQVLSFLLGDTGGVHP
jgi:hypothetical protein